MNTQLHQRSRASTGHSSDVKMSLHIGAAIIPVLQSGPDEIKVHDTAAVPQGDAILEINIDGRSHRQAVRVGAPVGPQWLAISDVD